MSGISVVLAGVSFYEGRKMGGKKSRTGTIKGRYTDRTICSKAGCEAQMVGKMVFPSSAVALESMGRAVWTVDRNGLPGTKARRKPGAFLPKKSGFIIDNSFGRRTLVRLLPGRDRIFAALATGCGSSGILSVRGSNLGRRF